MSIKDGDTYTLNVGDRAFPFKINVLVSHGARQKGLSGHPGLPSGTGMLFIFDTLSYQSMWMPDMKFALDIIWLDENMTVVNINYNTPPCVSKDVCVSYESVYLVKYAIEVRAGDAKTYGFTVGTSITIR
jgi:uncharacterized membrane protein (UPF0127 family)